MYVCVSWLIISILRETDSLVSKDVIDARATWRLSIYLAVHSYSNDANGTKRRMYIAICDRVSGMERKKKCKVNSRPCSGRRAAFLPWRFQPRLSRRSRSGPSSWIRTEIQTGPRFKKLVGVRRSRRHRVGVNPACLSRIRLNPRGPNALAM